MPMAAKLEQICAEAWPLAQLWFSSQQAKALPKDEKLSFCYDMLNKVSRSFAIVIQQLPAELRDPVCLFYLVLRALDTVEDDMTIPIKKKVPVLRNFHKTTYQRELSMRSRGWTMLCGEREYARLMRNYGIVIDAFLRLPEMHKQVIADITEKMGEGMALFIEKEVVTVHDYDLYCHYVAGLVGVGLSKLFAASGLESKELVSMEALSNEMGLFLQKTNIIRDYLEDITEEPAPRMFWPREIWGEYKEKLSDFQEAENCSAAVKALNHMVTDALRHATQSLEYLSHLQNTGILRFCAIPQVMAIATLAEIYNNPAVFTGVVKVRKGVVARYMVGLKRQADVFRAFAHFANAIHQKCSTEAAADPNSKLTAQRTQAILDKSTQTLRRLNEPSVPKRHTAALAIRIILLLAVAALLIGFEGFGHRTVKYLFHLLFTTPFLVLSTLLLYSSYLRL